ncbi:MAG: zf-HC2 domain-containing protein [Anaerolineae bacterium]|nr:zf-HC2 domain-containing protein [Gemmatimonadaceae bacterium]
MKAPSLFAPHPDDVSLKRFADGELPEQERERMTTHLTRCPDCRSTISFMRELRAAAAGLPKLEPPAGLLDRVTAERAAGERFILPADVDSAKPSRLRTSARGSLVFVAFAAASAVIFVRANKQDDAGDSARTAPVALSVDDTIAGPTSFLAGMFTPGVALAQVPPPASLAARAPITRVDGKLLKPGHFRFERRLIDSAGRSRTTSRGVVDIALASYDGRQAWRLVQSWTDSIVELDTIFVESHNLRPIGRVSRVRPYMRYDEIVVRQHFAGDSVLGWMHTDRTFGRPVRRRLPPEFGPYLPSEALAPFFLETVNVAAGWRGTLSVVGWAVVQNDVYFPLALRVVGDERITVPAGTFDCWRIEIASGKASVDFWVRKSDGFGVRTRKRSRAVPGEVEEVVYVRG